MSLNIQPTRVTRNPDGHWQHPDLPAHLFQLPNQEAMYWLHKNGYRSQMLHIGPHAEADAVNRWLNRESLPQDHWPKHYTHAGFFAAAVTQAEEELLVWMIRPTEGTPDENQSAA